MKNGVGGKTVWAVWGDVGVNSIQIRIQQEVVTRFQPEKGSPSETREGFFGGREFRWS